ncbi:MAG TPA: hypothetical protein VMV53_10680 [Acidimicrobiales bacterium]|nr:hypothetical protein [Acidimicrobiales bacterium]
MPDVFTALAGQGSLVDALGQFARHPVHAYLFTGVRRAQAHDAVLAMAAALQCDQFGCGECETCRRVSAGNDPDVYVAERSGVSWRIDELREAERVSRRRPLAGAYQIVVIEDVELTMTGSSPSGSALLKSLEEPPARTVFLLSAEELPDALDTVVSRCVTIRLKPLGEQDIIEVLTREGADHAGAEVAARASQGDLRRARVLVRDHALAARLDQWRSVPDDLAGTPSSASQVVAAIQRSLDEAMAPLVLMQEEELSRRANEARELGQRSVANRREVEAQFKRELRRFRLDELRFGLSALTGVYRDRMVDALGEAREGSARDEQRIRVALGAIDALGEATRRLSSNVDETLLLHDLMFSLMVL